MAGKYICENEYRDFINHVKYGGLSPEQIDRYCIYLEGKSLKGNNQDAKLAFLQEITKKAKCSSHYAEETEEYIKSKAFSDKMKAWLLNLIKSSGLYKDGKLDKLKAWLLNLIKKDGKLYKLKAILESDVDISEMEIDVLMKIESFLEKVDDEDQSLFKLFERYLFVLDSDDAKMFVCKNYSFKELALQFLYMSNIDMSEEKNKSNGLLVEYMMAIYRMYHKYLREFEANYLELIEKGRFLSQDEFVEGYKLFIESDFVVKKEMTHEEVFGRANVMPKEGITPEYVESVVLLNAMAREDESRDYIVKLFKESIPELETEKPLANVVKKLVLTPREEKEKDILDKAS